MLGLRAPGDQVELDVWRDGSKVQVDAKLGRCRARGKRAQPPRPAPTTAGKLGLALRPLQPDESADGAGGLVVEQAAAPAAAAGVQPGDVLLAVNGKPVTTRREVRARWPGPAGRSRC